MLQKMPFVTESCTEWIFDAKFSASNSQKPGRKD